LSTAAEFCKPGLRTGVVKLGYAEYAARLAKPGTRNAPYPKCTRAAGPATE